MNSDKKLAVLIDGDNIPSAYVKEMMEEITKYGSPTIKRIYGDWTKPHLKKWKNLYAGEYEPGSIKPEAPPRLPEKPDERPNEGAGELSSEGGSTVPSECPPVQESPDWGAVGKRASPLGEEAGPMPGGEHPDAGKHDGDHP